MKPGDLVRVLNTKMKYKVLYSDTIATKRLGEQHWMCRRIGRSCVDSYAESKLIKVL